MPRTISQYLPLDGDPGGAAHRADTQRNVRRTMLQERNPHRFEGVTSMTPQATLSAPKATHTPAGAALFLAYQNKEMAGLVGDLAINYGPEARDHPLRVPTGPSHLPFPNSPGPPSTTAAPNTSAGQLATLEHYDYTHPVRKHSNDAAARARRAETPSCTTALSQTCVKHSSPWLRMYV